jgi:Toastrack DUF4097
MLKRLTVTVLVIAAAAVVPQVAQLENIVNEKNAVNVKNETSISNVSNEATNHVSGDGEEAREEFLQTYPLNATGRVILENINGGVKIAVWDRNEVQVKATKRASNRERLGQMKIDVSTAPDLIKIKTVYPHDNQDYSYEEKDRSHNPGSVDYFLTVPRKARLESIDLVNGSIDIDSVEGEIKASSVNGRVTARRLTGSTRLSTVNGTVEAVFTRLDPASQISLGSVNGNVTIVIPSNSNAVLRASTVHGDISNQFGLEVQHGDYVGHELYGQIGSGGPRIKLGNVNGGIIIRHSEDGAKVSPATSLLAQKDKDKDKDKDKEKDSVLSDEDKRQLREESRRIAQEAQRQVREQMAQEREIARETERQVREQVRQQMEQERVQRQVELEARREVDRALRESQREIQAAQRQVERERRREMRAEARDVGEGVGRGMRFTDKETKTFAVTGTPRVNVNTYDGVVVVRGWDKPQVMYTATKRASDAQQLQDIGIKADQQGSTVSIVANNPDSNGSVSLEVYVPRKSSLTASTGDGRITLDGVSGDLTLRTGDGSVEVINANGILRVNTGDGPIKISRYDGQVEARTGDGPISLDGTFSGLTARTGSGTVTLAVPANASFTIETNAEDVTNQGLTMTEDTSPSRRMKRWKIGAGGKVFLITTGDGRILLRPR